MAVGYEGAALIGSELILCTGLDIPEGESRLDSAGAFRGSFDLSESISDVHAYDWPENNGSVSFEANTNIVTFLKSWMGSRDESKTVQMYPDGGSAQQFNECFWTSVNFNAAEGSAVTGSLDFVAIERSSEAIANNYISNRNGRLQDGTIPGYNSSALSSSQLGAFAGGVSGGDVQPVPYWLGVLISSEMIPSNSKITSWSVTINQEVVKYFKCEGLYTEAVAPFRVGIGAVTVELQVELYVVSSSYVVQQDVNDLTVDIGGVTIGMSDLELQNHAQNIATGSDLTSVEMTYAVHGLSVA